MYFRSYGLGKTWLDECVKRGPFEKQHGKHVQKLLKYKRQHLYHIYWLVWGQLSYKKSLLVIWKILRVFVNTLTADDRFSLLNRENSMQPIQMLLSQKQKIFLNFSLQFWNLVWISIIWKKNMTLIADVFPKIRTP